MEGLSVHREGGDTVVTLISDDNFSAFQQTLLLEFALADRAAVVRRGRASRRIRPARRRTARSTSAASASFTR